MAELLLDSNIRLWVFLPIIMITFLVGILRHYFSLIISSQKKVELLQVQDRYPHLHHSVAVNLVMCNHVFPQQSSPGSLQTFEGEWQIFAKAGFPDAPPLFQQ